jgi:hypothetical protein
VIKALWPWNTGKRFIYEQIPGWMDTVTPFIRPRNGCTVRGGLSKESPSARRKSNVDHSNTRGNLPPQKISFNDCVYFVG